MKELDALRKRAGLASVDDLLIGEACFVDTGVPALNKVLGREDGIPTSKIVELYGPESVGKTALSLYLISVFQEVGGVGILADIANDYEPDWGAVMGIDNDSLLIITLEERILNKRGQPKEVILEGMEDLFLKMANTVRACKELCPTKPVIIVWDDVAQTPTRKELDGDYGSDQFALQARALSKGLKLLYSEMHGSNVLLLCINQVRMKIGWVSYEEATGGRALKFYSSVRVKLKRKSKTVTKKERGISCVLENVKNKVSDPFEKVEFKIDTKQGLLF